MALHIGPYGDPWVPRVPGWTLDGPYVGPYGVPWSPKGHILVGPHGAPVVFVSSRQRRFSEMLGDFPELSGIFRDCPELSGIFRNCPGSSGFFRDFPGFSEIFRDFPGFSGIFRDPGKSWIFLEISGNSWKFSFGPKPLFCCALGPGLSEVDVQ